MNAFWYKESNITIPYIYLIIWKEKEMILVVKGMLLKKHVGHRI